MTFRLLALLLLFLLSSCGSVDIPTVLPLLSCPARGVNYTCSSSSCSENSTLSTSFSIIQNVGANWVQVVPVWYQDSLTSSQIYLHPTQSLVLDEIQKIISSARDQGFHVALKPHLDILDGHWRGEIQPSDLAAWQTSYENFILTFASMAQETGVEIFSVGTELKTQSGNRIFWKKLIDEIRSEYQGRLTYSANWDEYAQVAFWSEVDFVGIDFYFPLMTANTSEPAIEQALNISLTRLLAFSRSVNRHLLVSEVGYRSLEGTLAAPYDYQMTGAVDFQVQANAYQAFLNTFSDQAEVEGIFWWEMPSILSDSNQNTDYSFYGKPAQDVLGAVWNQAQCD